MIYGSTGKIEQLMMRGKIVSTVILYSIATSHVWFRVEGVDSWVQDYISYHG